MTTATAEDSRPVTVPLNKVEAELNRQLQVVMGTVGEPFQRARMSNLVVFCEAGEQVAYVTERVPELTTLHPARIILLIVDPQETGPDLDAEVRVSALGTNRFACSEQVILRASERNVDRLPFAVREVLVGDIPTNLWWVSHQPPPFAGSLIFDLSEHVEQVIYDSLGWTDPTRGVAATANWIAKFEGQTSLGPARVRVVSDLNWRRLKSWRRLLGQALDPSSAPGAYQSITELAVEHGPHAVTQAWQLVSWIAARLGWKVQDSKVQPGVEIDWFFEAKSGPVRVAIRRMNEGAPAISRVRLTCAIEGRGTCLDLQPDRGNRLSVVAEGTGAAPRTISVPELAPGELIGRQLSDREPDPIFRQSMEVAQTLAQSLLH